MERSLREWGNLMADYAKAYVITRNSSYEVYRTMRPQKDEDPEAESRARAELDEAISIGRSEFEGFLAETWEAFRRDHPEEGLCGSYFDLMTEVRETPENAENSLRDFMARSKDKN